MNGLLFDNLLNEKGFQVDIRMENGYEKGCTRGVVVLIGPRQCGKTTLARKLVDAKVFIGY